MLSKGNPEDFFDGHHAVEDFLQCVLPDRLHALGLRRLADLDARRIPDDQIANLLGGRHDLVDGYAPLHAREAARGATLAFVEVDLAQPLGHVSVGHERLLVGLVRLLALLAHAAPEALGEDQHQGGGHEEGRDAHVEQSGHGGRAVVRVQRGQDEVARERGPDADLSRFQVAGLADQDDVRILAQEGAQGPGKGAPDLFVDLHLVDALEVVLDGVLGRHDVDVGRVDGVDGRVKRGRFTRASGPRDQDHAVGAVDGLGELFEAPRVESEHGKVELQRVLVEDAHDGLFAEDRWEGGDAKVDLALIETELDTAVLGEAPLRDVQARHDLHARGERGLETLGRRHDLVEDTVDAEAHPEDLLVGLEVDVGRAPANGVHQDHVDQTHDRGLVGRLLQLEDVDLGRALFVALDQLDVSGGSLHLRNNVGDAPAFAVVGTVDGLTNRRLGGHHRDDLEVGHEPHVVQREDVRRVAHGERQLVALALDGQV